MGQQELETALRREGEEKAREIWRCAEQEALKLRDETDRRIAEVQEQCRAHQRMESLRLQEDAKAVVLHQARLRCLAAEAHLNERLKCMTAALLKSLGKKGGDSLFSELADEVPDYDWQQVKVAVQDEALAQARFFNAEINTDEKISGGLEVEGDDGRVVVINTLEKRLEHLWQELLPEMMTELRQGINDDGTTADDTSI